MNEKLKKIPYGTLRKVVREGKWQCLLDSEEGHSFFESWLNAEKSGIKVYWLFAGEGKNILKASSLNHNEKLEFVQRCYEIHVSKSALAEDKIDDCLNEEIVANLENPQICLDELEKLVESVFQHVGRKFLEFCTEDLVTEFKARSVP